MLTQLDLILLGRRAITARVSNVEDGLRALRLATIDPTSVESAPVRPNLFSNSSFEHYDRNATKPNGWTGTGSIVVGAALADGSITLRLDQTETIAQAAAEGANFAAGAVTVSVIARTSNANQKLTIAYTHSAGSNSGPIYRVDAAGDTVQTDVIPNDGNWYRFYRQMSIVGGAPFSVTFSNSGSSSGFIELDAAKCEREEGAVGYIDPSPYISSDYGAAVHIRNLSADNIIAGTLVVGGSGSSNPRISVLDGSDVEIVTLGDPIGGFYGIEVKGTAGIAVTGSGTISVASGGITVTGTGGVTVSGGGSVTIGNTGALAVTGTGGINVSGGGSINVTGTGSINLSGSGSLNVSGTGVVAITAANGLTVTGFGGISVSGGGSISVGSTGSVNVTGSGSINLSGSGSLNVSGTGRLNVTATGGFVLSGGGSIEVNGTGAINVNTSSGIVVSGGGSVTVGSSGSVVVSGTGVIRAGSPSTYHAELAAGGLALYGSDGVTQTVLLSSITGKFHIYGDPLDISSTGKLSFAPGLVWADNKGFWMIDGSGNAAFAVAGADAQTWGGFTLDKGDVLVGNTYGNYIQWDASAGKLRIGGELVVGTTNKIWLNDSADGALNIGGSTKASAPFRVTAAGALTATNATISGSITAVQAANPALTVAVNSNGFVADTTSLIIGAWPVMRFTYAGTDWGKFTAGIGASDAGFSLETFPPTGTTRAASIGLISKGAGATGTAGTAAASITLVYNNVSDGGVNILAGTRSSSATVVTLQNGTASIQLTGSAINAVGALKLGSPSYTPSSGQISTAGAIVAGAGLYPAGQTTYFVNSWAGGGLQINGNLSLVGALYPTNQSTYYWNFGTYTIANTMYTNANLESGARIYASDWFRSVGATGWFNHTYGGGIFMQNSSNVEVYGGKYFYAPAALGVQVNPTVFAGVWRFGVDGIGTTSGTYSAVFRNGAGTNLMYLQDGGAAWVNSTWIVGSDARYKTNVKTLAVSAVEIAKKLRGVSYTLIADEDERLHTGFIAQETEEVLPHLVSTSMDGKLALAYEELHPYWAKAIAELAERIESLEDELNKLKAH